MCKNKTNGHRDISCAKAPKVRGSYIDPLCSSLARLGRSNREFTYELEDRLAERGAYAQRLRTGLRLGAALSVKDSAERSDILSSFCTEESFASMWL